jgi:hypothetical protein
MTTNPVQQPWSARLDQLRHEVERLAGLMGVAIQGG